MNEKELMKLSEEYDEAINLSDFTTEEILQMAQSKQKNKSSKFKEKYFDFYDDVKSSSKKKQDW